MTAALRRLPALDRRRGVERAALSRLVLAHETALEVRLARTLADAGRRAARAFLADGPEAASVAAQATENGVRQALQPSLSATARAFADRLLSHPKCRHAFETKVFRDLDAAIAEWVDRHAATRVVQISAATREQIARVIRQGIDEGLGEQEIARRIEEATSSEIGQARARRIARTEAHFASMVGQQAAAEASPLAFTKEWLATEDKRTRRGHAEANGIRVPLEGLFGIAHYQGDNLIRHDRMRFPGDPDAPPEQVINCRCVCMYEPEEITSYPSSAFPTPEPAVAETTPPDRGDDVPRPAPQSRPEPVSIEPPPPAEPETRRRPSITVYSLAQYMVLDVGVPDTDAAIEALAGATVAMIGPSNTWDSPRAPNIAGYIAAAAPSWLDRLRNLRGASAPALAVWRIAVPAGIELPPGFVLAQGAYVAEAYGRSGEYVWNAGRPPFGAIPLYVRDVTRTSWDQVKREPAGSTEVWLIDCEMDPEAALPVES